MKDQGGNEVPGGQQPSWTTNETTRACCCCSSSAIGFILRVLARSIIERPQRLLVPKLASLKMPTRGSIDRRLLEWALQRG
jgi:hypothetical protein